MWGQHGRLIIRWGVVALLAAAFGARADAASALAGGDGLIAFTTIQGVSVASADGGNMRLLIPDARNAAWSPRGNRIAYVDRGSILWIANADGSHPRRVSIANEEGVFPAWSPDGRLSYSNGGHVVIVDADGRHRQVVDPSKQLGERAQIASGPSWTADGRLVLLLSVSHGGLAPYIARGDATHLHPLTLPGGGVPSSVTESHDWRFSSLGVIAYVSSPLDDWESVRLARLEGQHLTEPAGGFDPELQSRSAVALAPSGHTALLGRGSYLSVWNVDPETLAITLEPGGFTASDVVSDMDWQPLCTITGTPGDDEIVGTPGVDVICAGPGDDVIRGLGGNDLIFGGPGRDVIHGDPGKDVLVGGRGPDIIRGGRGADLINSRDERANDRLLGGRGVDTCLTDTSEALVLC
jgi:hypothetical protein